MTGAFVAIAAGYLDHRVFGTDEFHHVRRMREITAGLPYRDVPIIKNVLGLYLQYPIMTLAEDSWQAIRLLRLQMACVTALCFSVAAISLRAHYRAPAIILGLITVLSSSPMLEHAPAIRVDMICAAFALVGLVFQLRGRWWLSGLLFGLAFLCNQKAVYFIAAANMGGLLAVVMCQERRSLFRGMVRLNGAVAGLAALYYGFWSLLAGPTAVFERSFLGASRYAMMSGFRTGLYPNVGRFWGEIFARDPALFWLTGLGGILLLSQLLRTPRSPHTAMVLGFSLAICGVSYWHKEPWPYFFVIPATGVFVLMVATYDQVLGWADGGWKGRGLWIGVLGCLLWYLSAFPLGRVEENLAFNNQFQKQNVVLGDALLEEGETYFDGVGMLALHDQVAIPELLFLDRGRLRLLKRAGSVKQAAIVETLRHDPPKLYIRNERFARMPKSIRRFFRENYRHLHANIFLYAPRMERGTHALLIGLTGEYRLWLNENDGATQITLEGRTVMPKESMHLSKGPIMVSSPREGQLELKVATGDLPLDSHMRSSRRVIFRNRAR